MKHNILKIRDYNLNEKGPLDSKDDGWHNQKLL